MFTDPLNSLINRPVRLKRSHWFNVGIASTMIVLIAVASFQLASAVTATSSLWLSSSVPKTTNQDDSASIELGVKFTAKYAGQVTGIKFYKGTQNIGTHTGSLWDNNGNSLANIVFDNETTSGWQTAILPQPVKIAANVTYVVSYHAPKGHFSIDNGYFANSAHVSGPLTAFKSTDNNVNGVYQYSRHVKFPSNPSKADNYWVDVVYTTNTFTPAAKPAPPTKVTAAQNGTTVAVKWSASLSANPVSHYLIIRNGSQISSTSGTTLQFNDTGLIVGSRYSYNIRAVDSKNITSDDSLTAAVTYGTTATTPAPMPTSTPTSLPSTIPTAALTTTPTLTLTSPPPKLAGRSYPLHTNINSTTFWVGEQFQATADGSQVCSAYDSQWQYSFFHLRTGTNTGTGCHGAPTGGCDAAKKVATGKCDDVNSTASLRTPVNGYFPAGLPKIYESPFYLDLPYDDYNQSDGVDTTGYATRCKDVPWANDRGYVGHCTDQSFSYMKNRFVKIIANGKTCYGQIEDAGPADDGNGNGNYADSKYVFSKTDARPFNKSYNSAGMDVSPALNACLGGKFNTDLKVSWQFADNVDVPTGPWKTIITTTAPN